MNPLVKKILSILLVIAAMVCTVVWYRMGKINSTSTMMFMVVLIIPLFNMIRIVIQEWKDRK